MTDSLPTSPLPMVFVALRQATQAFQRNDWPLVEQHRKTPEALVALADGPAMRDPVAATALAALCLRSLRLLGGECLDLEAGSLLDSIQQLIPFNSSDTTSQNTEAVAVVLRSFQLSGREDQQALASSLVEMAKTESRNLFILLTLDKSPLIELLEGNPQPSGRSQASFPGSAPVPIQIPSSPLSSTHLAQVVSSAVTAAAHAFVNVPKPEPAGKTEELSKRPARLRPSKEDARLKRLSVESSAHRAPQRRCQSERVESNWQSNFVLQKQMIWAALAMLVIFGLLFVVPLDSHREVTQNNASTPVAPLPPDPKLKALYQPLRTVKAFMRTQDLSHRAKFLRDPSHGPLMENHFDHMQTQGIEQEIESIRPMGHSIVQGMNLHQFTVMFTDGRSRQIELIEEGPELLVDWPAYQRGDPSHWNTLLAGSTEPLELRCEASHSHYHNFAFDDPQKYLGFILRSPECEEPVYAYARRGSHRALILTGAIGNSDGRRVTLQLVSMQGSHHQRQFLVSKVTALTWSKGREDFEDSVYATTLPAIAKATTSIDLPAYSQGAF